MTPLRKYLLKLRFHYETQLMAYFMARPLGDIYHRVLVLQDTPTLPRAYEPLVKVLGQYLDVTVYRHTALLDGGLSASALTVVGSESDLDLFIEHFNKFYQKVEDRVQAKLLNYRGQGKLKRKAARKKGKTLKVPHARVVASNLRFASIEQIRVILNELLARKVKLPKARLPQEHGAAIKAYSQAKLNTRFKTMVYYVPTR